MYQHLHIVLCCIKDVNMVMGTRVPKKIPKPGYLLPELIPEPPIKRTFRLVSVALSTRCTLILATPPGVSCEAIEGDSVSLPTTLVANHYQLKHQTVNFCIL